MEWIEKFLTESPPPYCTLGWVLALPPTPWAQIGKKGVLIYYPKRRLEDTAGTYRYDAKFEK